MHPIDNRLVDIHNDAVAKAKGFAPAEPKKENVDTSPPARKFRRDQQFGRRSKPAFPAPDQHNAMVASRIEAKKKKAARKNATYKMKIKARKRG